MAQKRRILILSIEYVRCLFVEKLWNRGEASNWSHVHAAAARLLLYTKCCTVYEESIFSLPRSGAPKSGLTKLFFVKNDRCGTSLCAAYSECHTLSADRGVVLSVIVKFGLLDSIERILCALVLKSHLFAKNEYCRQRFNFCFTWCVADFYSEMSLQSVSGCHVLILGQFGLFLGCAVVTREIWPLILCVATCIDPR